MTDAISTPHESNLGQSSQPRSRWQNMDAWLDRSSDWFNPILVKEARQAMKSRSFVVTFGVVLVLAWAWTVFGMAIMSPGIKYVPSGRYMLIGYFVILAVPLALVVPFAAFRSMAAERESGTFELLSITDLKPWQVVLGKLGSAVLQIAVYLSALSPCLVFTYFLRGIDIFMILLLIGAATLISLFLSAFALLVGANVRPDRWQTAAAVALLVLLLFAGFMGTGSVIGVISSGASAPVQETNSWIIVAMVVSVWSCLFALVVVSAAAAITFPSDNRATPFRIAALVTHVVWFTWITWIWQMAEFNAEVCFAYLMPAAIFWWVMAAHLTGQPAELTPRIRRQLPQSFMGRMCLGLFFPGRGLGYLFSTANLIVVAVATIVLAVSSETGEAETVCFAAVMLVAYAIAYSGVAAMFMHLGAQHGYFGSARSIFVSIVIVILGCLVPLAIQMSNPKIFGRGYHDIQVTNCFWTMFRVFDGDYDFVAELGSWQAQWSSHLSLLIVPLLVVVSAAGILVINLIVASAEVLAARASTPDRVRKETSPKSVVEQPARQSPWD